MWNNKRIKVHETISIKLIKKGDIITVDDNKGIILTVNGKKIDPNQGTWAFPPYGCEEWEVIPNFEINKWYEFENGNKHIGKCFQVDEYNIQFMPWLCRKGQYLSQGDFAPVNTKLIKELKVEDECIQSVLPEGHEDKINTEKIVAAGKIYFCEFSNNTYIFLYDGTKTAKYINTKQSMYSTSSWGFWQSPDSKNLRLANEEEKQWLNKCIELNKFIPKEEALKPTIPEYVEVLAGFFLEKDQIGKIYKTSDSFPKHLQHCTVYTWQGVCTNDQKKYFKPSTKEAYEAQIKADFKSQTAEYKVGDCVLASGNISGYDNKYGYIEKIDEYSFDWKYLVKYDNNTRICSKIHSKATPKEDIVVPKSLVGRYVKALVDKPNCGAVTKGEIGQIIIDNPITLAADFPSQTGYSISRTMLTEGIRYELMPEEWRPEKTDTMEDLLAEAKRRYPKNTKIIILGESKITKTIVGELKWSELGGYIVDENSIAIYSKSAKIWAEIEKEEWKHQVGDWVEVLVSSGVNTKGDIGKITEISSSSCRVEVGKKGNAGNWVSNENMRKAELHEIPQEKLVSSQRVNSLSLENSKIWIGENQELADKVIAVAVKHKFNIYTYGKPINFFKFIDGALFKGHKGAIDKAGFDRCSSKEIFPKDLDIHMEIPLLNELKYVQSYDLYSKEQASTPIKRIQPIIIPVKAI